MNMPKLVPIPIETKNKFFLVRIWRWITSIRNWEIAEDWEFKLPGEHPTVVIPKGFVFNGASIPRPLWGVLSPTGLLFIPSLIHDYAYTYTYLWALDPSGKVYKYKKGTSRGFWDSLFRKINYQVNGMYLIGFIAWFVLVFLGWWDWSASRRNPEPEFTPNKPVLTE